MRLIISSGLKLKPDELRELDPPELLLDPPLRIQGGWADAVWLTMGKAASVATRPTSRWLGRYCIDIKPQMTSDIVRQATKASQAVILADDANRFQCIT
jgi:hypothetical protein